MNEAERGEDLLTPLVSRMTGNDFWPAIEAAGPQDRFETFDPLLVDDVLQAERSSVQYDRRRAFFSSFAWAVPTREAVDKIVEAVGGRSVLEICAGSGLWSKLLADAGLSVIATDRVSPGPGAHHPVQALEAELAVLEHRNRAALMACWPPFKDDCAFRALRAFTGDLTVYVGDPRFTAEQNFHALLESSWELLDAIPLPSWPGTRDGVRIFRRRPAPETES